MSRPERLELIDRIEELRQSKLVVFIQGDRKGLETRLGADVVPVFQEHLLDLGAQDRIDLFLYSTGGSPSAAYGLVCLLREFCRILNVIVPFKALSAATLLALGADEIVMTRLAQLGPIDASIIDPLGPVLPNGRISPVAVEDVNGFVDLAKDQLGLGDEDSMVKVLEHLASQVNPLVLGSVRRGQKQVPFLAKTLLRSHGVDSAVIDKCIRVLTEERYSHHYVISRFEAEEVLGLKIEKPSAEMETLILGLFAQYRDALMLGTPYYAAAALGDEASIFADLDRAIVESSGLSHVFRTNVKITGVEVSVPGQTPAVVGTRESLIQQGWVRDSTI